MIHHRNGSTTKLWRLWPWLLQPAVHQVNLLLLLLQEQGDLASTTGDEEPMYIQDEFASSDRNSQTGEAQVVPFHVLLLQLQPHRRSLLWNDEAYSLFL